MKLRVLLLVVLVVSTTACAGRPYFVDVDGLAAPERMTSLADRRYVLIPGNDGVTPDDLLFQEFAGYLSTALAAKGFEQAETLEDASVAVLVTYGISDPQDNLASYLIPTWGQTGVSAAHTTGTITTYGNNTANVSATTTYTPTFGVTGYASNTYSYKTYTRGISVSAYDLRAFLESERTVELWRTTATSTGASGDLRHVMPMLVAAIQPYIGVNTQGARKVTLRVNDVEVIKIRGREDQ